MKKCAIPGLVLVLRSLSVLASLPIVSSLVVMNSTISFISWRLLATADLNRDYDFPLIVFQHFVSALNFIKLHLENVTSASKS